MATIFRCSGSFIQAFDRVTGLRPNPALGAPGGYYVDSSQTMVYNGLQTSVRKRFSNRHSWDVNYTFGKSESTQGGDLSAYYIAAFENNQDFWDPEFDRGPSSNDSVIVSTRRSFTSCRVSAVARASPTEFSAVGRFRVSSKCDLVRLANHAAVRHRSQPARRR